MTTPITDTGRWTIETHEQSGGLWRIDMIDPRTNSLVNRRRDVQRGNIAAKTGLMVAEMSSV